MAGSFNPIPDGQWDPKRPVRELTAFAVAIVLTDDLRALLAIEGADGTRHDFIMPIDDAQEIAYTLLGATEQAEAEGASIKAAMELDAVVPYRNQTN